MMAFLSERLRSCREERLLWYGSGIMAIDVACTCGAKFRVKDEWAGRRAKCTKCGSVVSIPARAEPLPDLTNNDALGLTGQSAASPAATDGFSDLFDEQLSAAATASPLAAEANAAAQISVEFDVQLPNDQEVSGLIQENLHRHFARGSAGTYSQVELEVHVLDWNDHGNAKVVTLSFFGTVNGKRINKNFSRDNTEGAVAMGRAVNSAARMWDSAASAMRGASVSKQMAKFVEDILDEACVHIDRSAGCGNVAASRLWKFFDFLKAGLMTIAFVGTLVFAIVVGGGKSLKASIFMAAIAAGAVFVPLHVIQILTMPTSFYTQDPRGRRTLSRWKAKSVGALKFRVGVMVAISVAAFIGLWMAVSPSLSTGPGSDARTRSERPPSPPSDPSQLSRMVGGSGGKEIEKKGYDGTRAVYGIQYGEGEWEGDRTLRPFEPVFTPGRHGGTNTNKYETAKEGYAVGGLIVDVDVYVCAVQVIFMRIDDEGQLDPNDSYTSDWLGRPTGKTPVEINGDGRKVVGFRVRQMAALDAIGLIYE
jgi:hypothetical protein